MKRIALVFALVAAALTAAAALATARGLTPGVYQTKVAGARVAVLNGTWKVALAGPAFTIYRNNVTAVAGTSTVVGTKVTFHDLAGTFACKGAQAIGTYIATLTGTKLTFKAVSDSCAGRKLVLSYTYTKIA